MLTELGTATAAWEAGWWLHRRRQRSAVYRSALETAQALGRPLVVVGAPDRGATAGYGCGDISVDIEDSMCPAHLRADITKRLPFADDSAVVFVSCVLEYVDDYRAALSELERVAGKWLYLVRVEPWTLAAYLYPGAKRTLRSNRCPTLHAGDPASLFMV
jgi:hypothetical protein